ncbi:Na+/H+ antiporter subunit G [Luteimonas sp. SJ-92]|uniref:Na+/H+ antiporter subunit G n=1 Tax=Luteimonas salinisoli TaxID=2752307 RepID=A0A853J931_9GAMM|nr:Na+/H+ antiporter subunit G [Luteimonas salinisoli]NZA25365.1 Na+/H+ antiporter subunit G [Luteimonas salinisoli]
MSTAFEIMMVALLAVGAFFVLVGSLGLAKLSDFFKRLHGPTKASTLGVGCVMIASIGHHAVLGDGLGLRELLITGFLFITAPISAHLMAKAALALAAEDPRPSLPPRDEPQAGEGDGPRRAETGGRRS